MVRRGRAGGCGARAHRGCVGGLHDVAAAGLRSERGHAPGQPLQRAVPRLGRRGRAGEERLQRAAAGRVRTDARQRARRQRRQALCKLARRLLPPAALSPAQPPEGELGHGWCTAGWSRVRVGVTVGAHVMRHRVNNRLEVMCTMTQSDLRAPSRGACRSTWGAPWACAAAWRAWRSRAGTGARARPRRPGRRPCRAPAAPPPSPAGGAARRAQPRRSRLRRALPARSAALHCATGALAAHSLHSLPAARQPCCHNSHPSALPASRACSRALHHLDSPRTDRCRGRAGLGVQPAC